jgi:hypothetical protein
MNTTVRGPFIAVMLLFGALAFALLSARSSYPGARLELRCPPVSATTRGWVDFLLTDAPASLRVPPDTAGVDIMPDFQDVWIGQGWRLRVDVGEDSAAVPLGGADLPIAPLRTHLTECVDTVAQRPMHVTSYRERAGGLHGDFVVTAVWPLSKGSWLRMGGVAVDSGSQRLLTSIVRTLSFDTVSGTSSVRRPSRQCPELGTDTTGWSRIRLSLAPATLLLPGGGQRHRYMRPQAETFEWPRGRSVFEYHFVRTPGWQLPPPSDSGSTWCRFTVDGREAGLRIVRIRAGLPQMYEERAFVSLAPNEVLDVRGEVLRADSTALNEFITIMMSIRSLR